MICRINHPFIRIFYYIFGVCLKLFDSITCTVTLFLEAHINDIGINDIIARDVPDFRVSIATPHWVLEYHMEHLVKYHKRRYKY